MRTEWLLKMMTTVVMKPGVCFVILIAGCVLIAGGCDFNAPERPNALTINTADDISATQEQTVTLLVEADGGTPPYTYRWNVESVPDDPEDPFDGAIPDLPNNRESEVETLPFQVGRYVYRVLVTDAAGETKVDFVTINVRVTPLRATIDEEPEDGEPLLVVAAEPFTLTVNTNFEGDFEYTWRVLSGPEVELENEDEQTVTVTPVFPGEVELRVEVRRLDEFGRVNRDITLVVEQGGSFIVRAERPDLLLIDEPADITAAVTNDSLDPDALSYSWEIIKGDGKLSSAGGRTTTITGNRLETLQIRLTVTSQINGTRREAFEDILLAVIGDLKPQVRMTVTSVDEGITGNIVFELFADVAPKAVGNLLTYVDEGFYTRVLWHRVAVNPDGEPFVVQAGGFTAETDVAEGEEPRLMTKDPTRPPVIGEPDNGVGNTVGTIAMALVGNDPDSGTTQFFVNLADNDFLDDTFTVFGEVVEGFDRIEAMTAVETDRRDVVEGGSLSDVPVNDIVIAAFRRVEVSDGDRFESGGSGRTTNP
jgi:cyclophilin family peptidyl-prolyl cis-trans isomerase